MAALLFRFFMATHRGVRHKPFLLEIVGFSALSNTRSKPVIVPTVPMVLQHVFRRYHTREFVPETPLDGVSVLSLS